MYDKRIKENQLIYNIIPTIVTRNLSVESLQFCNGLTIINQGSNIITVNNAFLLYPGTIGTNSGESISFGGNQFEIFKGRIDIAFAAGGISKCIVLQKVYLENYGS